MNTEAVMCIAFAIPVWDTPPLHAFYDAEGQEAEEEADPGDAAGRVRRRGGEGRRTAADRHDVPGSLQGTEPARLPHPHRQAVASPAADHQVGAVVRRFQMNFLYRSSGRTPSSMG